MKGILLNYFGLAGTELGILAVVGLLTLYAIFDIFKSEFKDQNSKILFLVLVLAIPVLGSISYLLLRRSYKIPSSNKNGKMPL